jgi:hypothetical protein
MNYGREIRALTGEMLAIKIVFSHALARISALDPILAAAIMSGVDDAAAKLQTLATKSDEPKASDRAIEALTIVAALRAALITNQCR